MINGMGERTLLETSVNMPTSSTDVSAAFRKKVNVVLELSGRKNYALSLYGSKMILNVQIVFVDYLSFWTGPIHFGLVKIILDRSKL
jgi:hypothetical protein